MTALLREAIERAVAVGYLDPANERHAHVSAVIADELAQLSPAPAALSCALPFSAALRAAVERCLTGGDDLLDVTKLAALSHVSLRTFERRFVAETGFTPREWRRRVRLAQATIALATGANVTEAALAAGYASTSAFISSYRACYGKTPGSLRLRHSR